LKDQKGYKKPRGVPDYRRTGSQKRLLACLKQAKKKEKQARKKTHPPQSSFITLAWSGRVSMGIIFKNAAGLYFSGVFVFMLFCLTAKAATTNAAHANLYVIRPAFSG